MMGSKIEIPLHKGKLVKILVISLLLFIFAAGIIVIQPRTTGNFIFTNPVLYNLASVGGLLLGSIGIYFALPKLFDKKPGLIVDEEGVIDHSGNLSIGRIAWRDILEIRERVVPISNHRVIVISVINPDDYLLKQPSLYKRKLMSLNAKEAGSPISISVLSVRIDFDELKNILNQKFQEYQKSTS